MLFLVKIYEMFIKINSSWQNLLSDEFEKDYFKELIMAVDDEYKNHICFPSKELIFSAFNQFDFENLKVVIIGQDPYHGEGEANGLCFSVNDSIKIPPSLINVFNCRRLASLILSNINGSIALLNLPCLKI